MYFDVAEAKIVDLETKITALESVAPVDLSGLTDDVAALKVAAAGLQDAVAALDARLDAISAGAQG